MNAISIWWNPCIKENDFYIQAPFRRFQHNANSPGQLVQIL